MTNPPASAASLAPADRPIGAAAGLVVASSLLGALDVFALLVVPRVIGRGLVPVARHVVYAIGHALAIGLALAAATSAYLTLRRRAASGAIAPRPRREDAIAYASMAAASLFFGWLILRDDLEHLAGRLAKGSSVLAVGYLVALVTAVSLLVPAAAVAARFAARSALRWAALALAVALAVANHLILTPDYPGAHLEVFVAAVVVAGVAVGSVRVPSKLARAVPQPAIGLAVAAIAAWAGWSVLAAPPSRLRIEMLAVNGSNLEPFLARIQARASSSGRGADVPAAARAWFVDRSHAPPIAPTEPAAAPRDDIVILLTVDSMRADVVESGKYDDRLPEMTRMKREGLHFTRARSAGSQTIYSLSAIFAAKYFSQQHWAHHLTGVWPASDASVRFPTLLAAAGVATVTFASQDYLVNEFGVVRGFTEETDVELAGTERGTPPLAPALIDATIERLGRQGPGPLFLFVHFMDSHSPYYLAAGDERHFLDAFDGGHARFIASIAQVDAEIGRLRRALATTGLERRTTLIVSADHGEAFGEHGATMHGMNLYEELIRVPLLVVGPRVVARADATPVSLVDLGPTVLDLFGLPTPGSYMGQSLVPLLRGEKATLTRPIVAEGRLKQALVLPSGEKLIRNQREGTEEIYDLGKDPQEKDDRFEAMGAAGRDAMGILEAFFDAQRLRTPPGYEPPYVR